jgi:hypothetical protein
MRAAQIAAQSQADDWPPAPRCEIVLKGREFSSCRKPGKPNALQPQLLVCGRRVAPVCGFRHCYAGFAAPIRA